MPELDGGAGGGSSLPDPVTVAHGGTGATDAAGARTALGLGTAAVANLGTGASDAAYGNHNHSGIYEPADGNIQSHIASTSNPHSTSDANLVTSNITTNDVSITKHGFVPLAPNDTAKFLRGDGTWAVPAASGASTALDNLASVAINTSLISDTDNTDDLGSAAKAWQRAYGYGLRGKLGTAFKMHDDFVGAPNAAQTNGVALPASEGYHSHLVVNGYMYLIGGATGGTAVYYAKIAEDGSVGSWTATTSLPLARKQMAACVLNGYIYLMGGSGATTTVYFAKPNPDGSIPEWRTTTPLPAARENTYGVAVNGYVYFINGDNGGGGVTTCYYGKQMPNGEILAWNTTSATATGHWQGGVIAVGGYMYAMGGQSDKTVEYAKINADGTLGTWSTTTALPFTTAYVGFAIYASNGYIYLAKGAEDGTSEDNLHYARINADGTLGSWTTVTAFFPAHSFYVGFCQYNGYMYATGGWDGGSYRTYLYYFDVARTKHLGDIDLVGLSAQAVGDFAGKSGGSVYASDVHAQGDMEVSGQTMMHGGAFVRGALHVTDAFGIGKGNMFFGQKTLTDAATNLFDFNLLAGEMAGGVIFWTIEASDGTDHQSLSGMTTFASVNKGGTMTHTITNDTANDAKAVSGGTLTSTWTITDGTNEAHVNVEPTGSLTETTYRISYLVIMNTKNPVDIL